MDFNRKAFFDGFRETIAKGKLSEDQVRGTEALFDEVKRLAWSDKRHVAYLLATVWWETGGKMFPIDERGSDTYFFKMYDIEGDRPRVAQTLGNTHKGDGVKFHGRGFVQVTGRANYTDWAKRLELDLVGNPGLANNIEVASVIACYGMEKGTFTNRKLRDYFNSTTDDPINARRVINGVDKAKEIADLHKLFLNILDETIITGITVPEQLNSLIEERLAKVEETLKRMKEALEGF